MLNNKVIGQYIRDARVAKGYKQDFIAHKLNLSQNAYSKTELGKSNLTLDRMFALSVILDFEILDMIKAINTEASPKISVNAAIE